MKRTHKVLFESLMQEEYNRGYDDCKKTVMQNLRVETQKGKTRIVRTPKGQTRGKLLSLMRASPSPKSIKGWTEFFNETHNLSLSEGAISGALFRMKEEGLAVFDKLGWQASVDEVFALKEKKSNE